MKGTVQTGGCVYPTPAIAADQECEFSVGRSLAFSGLLYEVP